MDVLDIFLKKYSYKFPKGYPDMNNEQDILLMEEILSELDINMLNEEGQSESYNKIITNKLGNLPIPVGEYTLGKNVNVSGEDAKIFKELYPISPPKKGSKDEVGSKGSGNGEIAMYWLLSKNYNVQDSRKGGDPDLLINGSIGLEVKSYDSNIMALGRFGSDKENIELLNSIFGLYSLITTLEHKQLNKANALSFSSKELIEAFKEVSNFSKEDKLRDLEFPIIKNMYGNIDKVLLQLGIESHDFSPEEASAKMFKKLLLKKLTVKPGLNGFIVNVDVNGNIEYHGVTEEKINALTLDQLNSYVSANQGTLNIYPDKLF
jgi:hypothetical protein